MSYNRKFYWLKLPKDFFEDKAIKKLRSIAGGDTYTIIYLKMMLRSLENNGHLYYEGIEETIAEEIALDIDENVDDVSVTISYLVKKGLMIVCDSDVELPQLQGMVGQEGASAERVRNLRERKKQQIALQDGLKQSKALHCNTDVTNCNAPVTKCNVEKEIEKEKDIEIDKETFTNVNVKKVSHQTEEWFSVFWTAYPNKTNKKKSKEIFSKLCTSEMMFNTIMNGMKKTVILKAKYEGKQYIPMASSWLNGERWNDEAYQPPISKPRYGYTQAMPEYMSQTNSTKHESATDEDKAEVEELLKQMKSHA